jgi:hypothetical protein
MLKRNIDNPILNKMPTYFGMTNYYNPLIEQKKINFLKFLIISLTFFVLFNDKFKI